MLRRSGPWWRFWKGFLELYAGYLNSAIIDAFASTLDQAAVMAVRVDAANCLGRSMSGPGLSRVPGPTG